MTRRAHWQRVYAEKPSTEVSWYQPHLSASLQLIEETGIGADSRVIDIGGGSSTLVDDLLAAGFSSVAVLDISARAMAVSQQRLGAKSAAVRWLEGDVTELELPRASFDLWHDRAAFHFLVDESDQGRYVAALDRALVRGGHVILATFAPAGPKRCSGLEVRRNDAAGLHGVLGDEYELRRELPEAHRTPSGGEQLFTYCWFQRHR